MKNRSKPQQPSHDGLEDRASSFFSHNLTIRQILTSRPVTWVAGVVVLAGLVAGLGAAHASRDTAESATQQDAAMPVVTLVAQPVESYDAARSYTGSLVAARASRLSFERPGKVTQVLTDEGHTVEPGQKLAQLDTRHLLVAQKRLQAERAQAAAQLAELRAGPRVQTISAAKAEVRNLEAQRDQVRRNFDRIRKLRGQNVITETEYEDALYTARAVAAQLDAAQKKLDELEAGTRKERVAAQQAMVEQLDARLADLALDIEDATLVAPFAGRVARRLIDEGTVIAAGTPVLELVEQATLEAWVGVPAETAARLTIGSSHNVWVGDKSYAATLTALAPELDAATRTRKAIFTLAADADSPLVPSQVARVDLTETIDARGYWLPADALVRSTRGLWSALVVISDADSPEREVTERRDVELLYTAGSRVLVRGTLEPGDKVVSSGVHRIVAGQRVESGSTLDPLSQVTTSK